MHICVYWYTLVNAYVYIYIYIHIYVYIWLASALGNSMLLPETVVGFTCLNAVRYFFMMHFRFEGGCGDIQLGTSYICFCMDLTRVEACWVLTTCPNRSAKNQYPVRSRSHLRQDAEDVQRNDFISKLFAKIEGTPKHT